VPELIAPPLFVAKPFLAKLKQGTLDPNRWNNLDLDIINRSFTLVNQPWVVIYRLRLGD